MKRGDRCENVVGRRGSPKRKGKKGGAEDERQLIAPPIQKITSLRDSLDLTGMGEVSRWEEKVRENGEVHG